MDNKTLAKVILKDLGGEDNIISFIHIGDRVRFNLKDNSKIDNEHLRQTKRVVGTFVTCGQFQVVLSHDADRLYKRLKSLTVEEKKKKLFSREKPQIDELIIYSPIRGEIIEVENAVGVMPRTNLLVSPVNGIIDEIISEKSAVNLLSDDGVKISIHIGQNIGGLRSGHTRSLTAEGAKIRYGDPIFEFEPTAMRIEGCEPITIVEVTDAKGFSQVKNETGEAVEKQPLIYLKR